MSPKPQKNNDEAELVIEYLREFPMATYSELGRLFPGREDVNINSIIKKLQRQGRVEIEKKVDDNARFIGSYKRVV